jgi:hypothetical protein
MSQAYTLKFIHRLNGDGTVDSICRDCFATVATALSEPDLREDEQVHVCDTAILERYKKVRSGVKIFPSFHPAWSKMHTR